MQFDRTVLQVIPSLDAGGAERTTLEMTRAIIAAGGRALVATSGGRMRSDVERAGGRVIILPVRSKNPFVIAANGLRLARLIRAESVDIVHARSRAPAWSAYFAARRAGVPFVATYHGAYGARTPWKRFYNSAMARADLVIANSAFTADAVRALYRVGDRLKVIPRGADLKAFNPEAISPERRKALAVRWGLPEEARPFIILLPGRVTGWKGHRVAVEAIAELNRLKGDGGRTGVSADLQLIFAGDLQGRGEFAASLMRSVEKLGLQQMIRWVGHCDDMPAAYALADVVLSPSIRPEAFGRVAAEAGAMGKVAIAAAHGGARETIIDGETGFLVEPNSPTALASAIARAAAMGSAGRAGMGRRARERIAGSFSIDAMTGATIAAYGEVLARTRDAEGSVH